eukprot:gnl/MRDRNA2_/MRDRNA2_134105_c0_seq1.p1 gnl/MRDRNA2_/MRDRNA2_134105_c0~~gnl/MRDRNA2_/MRDRNA2_134105_c0_seq1.p1  ORF type:complete len:310 (+),score=48.13 gnl/MRDRNA2_/MRDRNA2_134105_c0_seq1:74-1003(+)
MADGSGGLWESAPEEVLALVINYLDDDAVTASFLPTSRRWYCATVCHPNTFREPLRIWQACACPTLHSKALCLKEPGSLAVDDPASLGIDYTDEERALSELSVSFTKVLLSYLQKLGKLCNWLTQPANEPMNLAPRDDPKILTRVQYLSRELAEFRARATVLADAAAALGLRSPDPKVPLRWADWLDGAQGAPTVTEDHKLQFRQQREQVATIWSSNRRELHSMAKHIESLGHLFSGRNEVSKDYESLGLRKTSRHRTKEDANGRKRRSGRTHSCEKLCGSKSHGHGKEKHKSRHTRSRLAAAVVIEDV